MNNWEDIRETLEEMQRGQIRYAETVLAAQKAHAADVFVLTEVIQCLAASVKDLNPVMERLLSRKDATLPTTSQDLAPLYAERFDQWHTRLLYTQRVG